MNEARPRVAAVVAARMSSARLPGKALMDIGGRPALTLLLERLKRARELDAVVVATSVDPSDDPIAAAAEAAGAQVIRGPLDDVLERNRLACDAVGAAAIARITADCPVLDPEVVDEVVALWRRTGARYVTNTLEPRTWPDGMDVEVISADALAVSAAETDDPYDREHVSEFVRSRPERFPHARLDLNRDLSHVRVTLDLPEDLDLLRRVVTSAGPAATMAEILVALGEDPHGLATSES